MREGLTRVFNGNMGEEPEGSTGQTRASGFWAEERGGRWGVGSKTRNVNYWRSWKALEILSWELKIYISGLSFVLTRTSTLHYER